VALELGRRLLASGAVTSAQVQAALYAHVARDLPFLRALVEVASVPSVLVDHEAARSQAPELRNVVPLLDVVLRLPAGFCQSLMAVPVRADPLTATVDVATVDPFDPHIPQEFAFHLNAPVRVVRSPWTAMLSALESLRHQENEQANRNPSRRRRAPTPIFGSRVVRPPAAARTGSSEIPIPLVRRSQAPKPANAAINPIVTNHSDADDPGRITQDAIILDPGSLPAARPAVLDGKPSLDGVSVEAVRIRIPAAPSLPTIESGPIASTDGSDAPPSTVPWPLDPIVGLDPALTALKRASTRDEVVLAILHGMSSVAGRVGIFAVRRATFNGWACTPGFAAEDLFRAISVDRSSPTILSEATTRGWYLGPIPSTPAHEQIQQLLVGLTGEVAIVAVELTGRAAMLILAAQLGDSMIATRTAERLAHAGADALLRVLRSEKTQSR
jgi:hypothetical protein